MRYNLRLRQFLDELVKSLLEEVETLVAWFRRLSLKRRQIAAKQQFWKLFTHTIRGKEKANANCKLQQNKTKNVYLSPFGEKNKITNCSKKWPYSPFREKKKHFANCSKKTVQSHHWGKEKANCIRLDKMLQNLFSKVAFFLQNVSVFHTFQHMPMLSRTC